MGDQSGIGGRRQASVLAVVAMVALVVGFGLGAIMIPGSQEQRANRPYYGVAAVGGDDGAALPIVPLYAVDNTLHGGVNTSVGGLFAADSRTLGYCFPNGHGLAGTSLTNDTLYYYVDSRTNATRWYSRLANQPVHPTDIPLGESARALWKYGSVDAEVTTVLLVHMNASELSPRARAVAPGGVIGIHDITHACTQALLRKDATQLGEGIVASLPEFQRSPWILVDPVSGSVWDLQSFVKDWLVPA